MSVKTQAKVLRALQEQVVEPVGGTSSVRVDVRVIAATNKDLPTEIRAGRFREDLYFRLNVIPIFVPPLRDRDQDIPLLAEHFMAEFAREYGRRPKRLDPGAAAGLRSYRWPGNVRELRNVCERAVLMGWTAVAPILGPSPQAGVAATALVDISRPLLEARQELVERFERDYLTRLLREHRGRVGEVARAAGIAERNLYEKMKQYGLSRDDYR
jgi:two-component system, NtrC family, response regulator AtoC